MRKAGTREGADRADLPVCLRQRRLRGPARNSFSSRDHPVATARPCFRSCAGAGPAGACWSKRQQMPSKGTPGPKAPAASPAVPGYSNPRCSDLCSRGRASPPAARYKGRATGRSTPKVLDQLRPTRPDWCFFCACRTLTHQESRGHHFVLIRHEPPGVRPGRSS